MHLQSALYRCCIFLSSPKANNIIIIIFLTFCLAWSEWEQAQPNFQLHINCYFFCSFIHFLFFISGSTFFGSSSSINKNFISFLSYTHNSFLCTHIHHIYNLFFFGKVRRKREERKEGEKNWFKFIVLRRRISCRGGGKEELLLLFFQLKRWNCFESA